MFAGYVTASLPLILLFCFASKSFVSGLTQGAVKG
jgi:ABC-type glycerol-3-phosphate transport system permease component